MRANGDALLRGERKRGFDRHAVKRHMQVGARNSVAMNLSRDRGGLAQRGINFFPIDVSSFSEWGKSHHGEKGQERQVSFHRSLLGCPQALIDAP